MEINVGSFHFISFIIKHQFNTYDLSVALLKSTTGGNESAADACRERL